MNKLIIIFVAICIIFATVSLLDTASATSPKTIDKNSVILNSEKTLSWDVKTYSNKKIIIKQIKVSKKVVKDDIITNATVTEKNYVKIENYKKNKLKLTFSTLKITIDTYINYKNESNIVSEVKYVKSKLNPLSYYLKVYKSKMIKNVPKKITFDIGYAPLKKDNNTTLKFNAIFYKNGKVVYYKKYYGALIGGNTVTTIEKYKTNKLKITTIYLTGTPGNKKVSYVSSKYLPKEYYLKVLRPKMVKNLVSEVVFDKGEKEDVSGSGFVEWSATSFIGLSGKFVSSRYNIGETYPTMKLYMPGGTYVINIEKCGENRLKITYSNGSMLTKKVTFVETSYTPEQYYLKVFKSQESFPYYNLS